jgi:pSer/pThr/pTyr-binding forkhead associated (FHA) protein
VHPNRRFEMAEDAREAAQPAVGFWITQGPGAGQMFEVSTQSLILGRDTGVSALAADVQVSRRHAEVRTEADGNVTVVDLGSSNGTFVNGRRITGQSPLAVGDRLLIGNTEMLLAPANELRSPSPRPQRARSGRSEIDRGNTRLTTQATVPKSPVTTGTDWLTTGRQHFERGDLLGSRRAFTRALTDSDDPATAHYGLGLVELAAGDLGAAEVEFGRAAKLDVLQGNPLFQLGVIAERRADLRGARAWYRRTLDINPLHQSAQARLRELSPSRQETESRPAEPADTRADLSPGQRDEVADPPAATPFGPGIMTLLEQDSSQISRQAIELMREIDLRTRPRFIAHFGRHAGAILLLVFLVVLLLIRAASADGDSGGAAGAVVVALVLLLVAIGWVAVVKTTDIRIAQGRIQIERGLLRRRLQNVDLWRVLNVNLDRSFFNRLTGDGTLELVIPIDPLSSSRRERKKSQTLKVTGVATGRELIVLHQRLLNLTFLLRGNPVVKGIIQ